MQIHIIVACIRAANNKTFAGNSQSVEKTANRRLRAGEIPGENPTSVGFSFGGGRFIRALSNQISLGPFYTGVVP